MNGALTLQRQPRSAERPPVAGVNKDPKLIRPVRSVLRTADLARVPILSAVTRATRTTSSDGLVERLGRPASTRWWYVAWLRAGHFARRSCPPPSSTSRRDQDAHRRGVREPCSRNLYRVLCPQCRRIDETEIVETSGESVSYRCQSCGLENRQPVSRLCGKLSWKLDCAARWKLYRVDTEVVLRRRTSPTRHAQRLDAGVPAVLRQPHPSIVGYGDLRMNPPARASSTSCAADPGEAPADRALHSDLTSPRTSSEHFANSFEIDTGVVPSRATRVESFPARRWRSFPTNAVPSLPA